MPPIVTDTSTDTAKAGDTGAAWPASNCTVGSAARDLDSLDGSQSGAEKSNRFTCAGRRPRADRQSASVVEGNRHAPASYVHREHTGSNLIHLHRFRNGENPLVLDDDLLRPYGQVERNHAVDGLVAGKAQRRRESSPYSTVLVALLRHKKYGSSGKSV